MPAIQEIQLKLRPSLFWDAEVMSIDLQKHKKQVIERIMTRGRWEEYQEMLLFYGIDTVREIMLNARHLDKYTLAFCSTTFNIPITSFRCYKLAQSNPTHWDY